MKTFFGFAWRNPSHVTKNARKSWATQKAMKEFRKHHDSCAACGRTKKLQVHHIFPVSVSPERADDPNNMLTMCAKCHLRLGHSGDFGRRYVPNIKPVCDIIRINQIKVKKSKVV